MYERSEAEQVGRQAHEDLVTCERCHQLESDADARSTPDGNLALCRTCAAIPTMCRDCAQVYTLADLTEDGRCAECPAPDQSDEQDSARSLGL